jgi:hypothetical protein
MVQNTPAPPHGKAIFRQRKGSELWKTEVRYRDHLNGYNLRLPYWNMMKPRKNLNKPSSFPCFYTPCSYISHH